MRIIERTYHLINKYKFEIVFDTEHLMILTIKNHPNSFIYIYPNNNILKIKTDKNDYENLPVIFEQKKIYNISSNIKLDEILLKISKYYETS